MILLRSRVEFVLFVRGFDRKEVKEFVFTKLSEANRHFRSCYGKADLIEFKMNEKCIIETKVLKSRHNNEFKEASDIL